MRSFLSPASTAGGTSPGNSSFASGNAITVKESPSNGVSFTAMTGRNELSAEKLKDNLKE